MHNFYCVILECLTTIVIEIKEAPNIQIEENQLYLNRYKCVAFCLFQKRNAKNFILTLS